MSFLLPQDFEEGPTPVPTCRRALRGWRCYLPQGHDGPCPAWPSLWTRIRYNLWWMGWPARSEMQ